MTTTIVWPGTLPFPELMDSAYEPADGRITTPVEMGPPKIRLRSALTVTGLPAATAFYTGAQLADLDVFWTTTTSGGTARFLRPDPVTGAVVEMSFVRRPRHRPHVPDQHAALRTWRVTFELRDPHVKTGSAPFMQAIGDVQTGQEPLVVLTIDHASFGAPIRLVDAAANVVRDGDTYSWAPFRVTLPAETKDELPTVQVVLDAVDRTVGDAIRALSGDAPTVEFAVVLASSPDVTEMGPYHFSLASATGDAASLTGQLAMPAILDEPCPGGSMTPADYPSLFDR